MQYDPHVCAGRLRDLREQSPNKVSQTDLAGDLGVFKQAVSRWENGNTGIPIDSAFIIADRFHVTLDYLYGRSDDKNPQAEGITEYTGISPQAAKVLHDLPIFFSADCVAILNDLILSDNFPAMLMRLAYLQKRSAELAESDVAPQEKQLRQVARLQKQVDADCGFGVVVTGINALYYEAEGILREVRRWIANACGITEAECAIAEKTKALHVAELKQRKGRKHDR